MKRGVVIQARMGSTRLPGKVLRTVRGRTLLELCARRAAEARHADLVVVATTKRSEDDAIAAEAARLGFPAVRGSEADVLARYALAGRAHDLDVVCRVTSDCPLIDPGVIDRVFDVFFGERCDYASNTLRRTFPRGLDVEVFSRSALERADREAAGPAEREHVTPYLWGHPELFALGSLEAEEDHSSFRWTVDEEDDLRFIAAVADRFERDPLTLRYEEVLVAVRADPALPALNAHVEQKKV